MGLMVGGCMGGGDKPPYRHFGVYSCGPGVA